MLSFSAVWAGAKALGNKTTWKAIVAGLALALVFGAYLWGHHKGFAEASLEGRAQALEQHIQEQRRQSAANATAKAAEARDIDQISAAEDRLLKVLEDNRHEAQAEAAQRAAAPADRDLGEADFPPHLQAPAAAPVGLSASSVRRLNKVR